MQIPRREDVVTPLLIERNARERPDGLMATFEDGTIWTWRDAVAVSRRAANALHANGVRQGDSVAVLLPNGADFLTAWLGISALGAALVPVNVAFRGAMLDHLVATARPVRMVTAGALIDEVTAVAADLPIITPTLLSAGADRPVPLERDIEIWDTHHIMLTGGTTGPSKAARCSHLHFHNVGLYGTVDRDLGEDDVFLIDLPLFHTAALGMVSGCVSSRTPVAVRSAPNLRNYWQTIKLTGATIAVTLSSMVGYLMSQPPSPADTDHRLRFLITIPVPGDQDEFMARFGIPELIGAMGGTEASVCISTTPGVPIPPQSCGKLRPGFQARLVDEHDIPVPPGEVGELVLRHDVPWSLFTEYVGDPAATATAWRNGWFHTGDLLRKDAAGNFYFVDRSKDAIRRRGENISCYEVERQIATFPGVQEVACVAAPDSMGTDSEMKVWIVPADDQIIDFDFDKLFRYLYKTLPHFMVPRYFELTDTLPKNASMKIQKYILRERGDSPRTWDCEEHGRVRLTSRGLVEVDKDPVDAGSSSSTPSSSTAVSSTALSSSAAR